MKFLFKDYQESVSFQKAEKMRTILLSNNKWNKFPNIGCDQHLSEEIGILFALLQNHSVFGWKYKSHTISPIR